MYGGKYSTASRANTAHPDSELSKRRLRYVNINIPIVGDPDRKWRFHGLVA
jgi:hypothetical protein